MDFSTIVQSDLNQQLSFINGILLFERSLSLAANAEVTIYSLIGQELFKTDNNYLMDSNITQPLRQQGVTLLVFNLFYSQTNSFRRTD